MASTEDFGLSDLSRARSSGYQEEGLSHVYSRHFRIEDRSLEQVSLPRADGGKEAWLFLAGCFCIEALTWGECLQRQDHGLYSNACFVLSLFSYSRRKSNCMPKLRMQAISISAISYCELFLRFGLSKGKHSFYEYH